MHFRKEESDFQQSLNIKSWKTKCYSQIQQHLEIISRNCLPNWNGNSKVTFMLEKERKMHFLAYKN